MLDRERQAQERNLWTRASQAGLQTAPTGPRRHPTVNGQFTQR